MANNIEFTAQLRINATGDYNGNGQFECTDIDALVSDVVSGNNSASFDLTGDGLVNSDDMDAWLAEAGEANLGPGKTYQYGDGNLDGFVEVADFNIWNENKFTSTTGWCEGDFTADGSVDVSDFNAWNDHKFTTADALVVPEPHGLVLLLLLGAFVGFAKSRRDDSPAYDNHQHYPLNRNELPAWMLQRSRSR